ncbi:hypothetical protein Cme02nite_35350 [Catellatospora methionotrophica]|uniref:DUF3040 domain-containing protein n=1 Tax=Catellatospora methionotrophica TaxID=121620 RepID=A0A8J3L677_9ACTN|nr:DUF3040 domain-containing protein [Catellatospora methionotrophica]GIG15203.1 hypothetical protein Cme02nite_35350 [Catellatospora methionotrophica]
MSLRPEEQELLEGLAAYTRVSDPAFVAGLANGVALPPVEYRRLHRARLASALAAAGSALAGLVLAVGWLAGALAETSTAVAVRW